MEAQAIVRFSSYNKDGVYLLIVYDDGDFVYENGDHTNKNYSITIKGPITCNLIWEKDIDQE